MKYWMLLVLLAPAVASAATPVAETVLVTASRFEEPASGVSQAVTVIDSETIEKNQYQDLSGLLEAYGFSIDSYGPGQAQSQVGIRGMKTSFSNPLDSDVLILVDGAPIATTNLAEIPMDGIERIEIMRGPAAVQYGSSAVGGVVNIIPRQGGRVFHLSAEAGYGSWVSTRLQGALSGKRGLLDFSGAVSWNARRNNYTTGDGDLYQDTQTDGDLAYLFNMGLNFNEDNRLGAVILGSSALGLGQSQSLQTEKANNGLGSTGSRVNSSVNVTYQGAYKPEGVAWKARYFNAYDQLKISYPGDYPLNGPFYTYQDYGIENYQTGGEGQISWNRQFLTMTGGMDYTVSEYSSGFAPRYRQTDLGAYGIVKLEFMDDLLILTGGARFDNYNFEVEGRSQILRNASFSGGVVLNPLNWLALRANIGQSYKVPSGLAVVGYHGPSGVKGNPDLEPEKGLTWDVGAGVKAGALQAGLTYFSTLYRDKVISRSINDAEFSSQYYNESGESFVNGLEGSFSLDLGELYDWDFALRPYLNFTRLFEYRDAQGNRLPNTRELTAAFGVGFLYPDLGLDADLRFTWLGQQREQDFDADYPYPFVTTGDKLIGDLFVSKTVCDEDWGKLSLKGEIRNFTDENYAYRYGYPLPGRSFYLGVRYDY